MKLFACPSCSLVVFFGNVACERCNAQLGYDPTANRMRAHGPDEPWQYCGNRAHDVCNWIVPEGSAPGTLCRACRHNVTIPDLSAPAHVALWRQVEEAKRRLIYTVLRLGLPLHDRVERPVDGLGFSFLHDGNGEVVTGHAGGMITIALAEADNVEREKRRSALREPYRTMLGHFRHEIGHWYWDLLVRDDAETRAEFTQRFGDADADYRGALDRHYQVGPPPDWQARFISTYASSHPWEDFAETWAHYFHLLDTLEVGGSFGIALAPRLDREHVLTTTLDFDVYAPDMTIGRLAAAWIALSSALNSFNRSMGLQDVYPFVLSGEARAKLAFVHRLVRRRAIA